MVVSPGMYASPADSACLDRGEVGIFDGRGLDQRAWVPIERTGDALFVDLKALARSQVGNLLDRYVAGERRTEHGIACDGLPVDRVA